MNLPQFGPRLPAETLRRFWTMLAHGQGGLLNVARLARNLGVDVKTVGRYIDLLVDLLLVFPGGDRWAVEIKHSLSPRPKRGFHAACADLESEKRFVVYPGDESFPLGNGVQAISLPALARLLAEGAP